MVVLELGFEITTRGVPSSPTWRGLLAPPTPAYQVCRARPRRGRGGGWSDSRDSSLIRVPEHDPVSGGQRDLTLLSSYKRFLYGWFLLSSMVSITQELKCHEVFVRPTSWPCSLGLEK